MGKINLQNVKSKASKRRDAKKEENKEKERERREAERKARERRERIEKQQKLEELQKRTQQELEELQKRQQQELEELREKEEQQKLEEQEKRKRIEEERNPKITILENVKEIEAIQEKRRKEFLNKIAFSSPVDRVYAKKLLKEELDKCKELKDSNSIEDRIEGLKLKMKIIKQLERLNAGSCEQVAYAKELEYKRLHDGNDNKQSEYGIDL